MDVTSVLDQLNTAQEQAVTSDKKHLLVLAGAGSGKTRVLVHRIAWKIQVDNVSPYGILAVTFTNKAAREMRERIDNLLGMSLRGMWVGTFMVWLIAFLKPIGAMLSCPRISKF
jgi:DNA helicase-2/ATP-dependent DNA helicase PcrA